MSGITQALFMASSGLPVSYVTFSTRQGAGAFSVSVSAGDTVIGLLFERSSTATISMTGFSNTVFTDTSFGGKGVCYATTAGSSGTFSSTVSTTGASSGTSTLCMMIVFRNSTLNPASVSNSGTTNLANINVSFPSLAGFLSGDIALAVAFVDNGSYVSSTPILSSIGFTGIGSARVNTTDGDLIASYFTATSNGSIPSTATTSPLVTSGDSRGVIFRIPA